MSGSLSAAKSCELGLDVGVARDAGVHEHQVVEEQHVRQRLEQLHVLGEHLAGHVVEQRVDRLGRLDAAVDPAAILDVVLVVAAQREHVLGRGEEQLHHRAQDAVVREPAAIDVVAEQDQLGLGLAVVEPPGLELGEEVGLEQRALEAAVAAVQIAEHGELVDPAGLGGVDVDVAVEERPLAGEVGDRLLAGELAGAGGALLGRAWRRTAASDRDRRRPGRGSSSGSAE